MSVPSKPTEQPMIRDTTMIWCACTDVLATGQLLWKGLLGALVGNSVLKEKLSMVYHLNPKP